MHGLVAPVDQALDEPVPKEDLPAPDGPATKSIVPRGLGHGRIITAIR